MEEVHDERTPNRRHRKSVLDATFALPESPKAGAGGREGFSPASPPVALSMTMPPPPSLDISLVGGVGLSRTAEPGSSKSLGDARAVAVALPVLSLVGAVGLPCKGEPDSAKSHGDTWGTTPVRRSSTIDTLSRIKIRQSIKIKSSRTHSNLKRAGTAPASEKEKEKLGSLSEFLELSSATLETAKECLLPTSPLRPPAVDQKRDWARSLREGLAKRESSLRHGRKVSKRGDKENNGTYPQDPKLSHRPRLPSSDAGQKRAFPTKVTRRRNSEIVLSRPIPGRINTKLAQRKKISKGSLGTTPVSCPASNPPTKAQPLNKARRLTHRSASFTFQDNSKLLEDTFGDDDEDAGSSDSSDSDESDVVVVSARPTSSLSIFGDDPTEEDLLYPDELRERLASGSGSRAWRDSMSREDAKVEFFGVLQKHEQACLLVLLPRRLYVILYVWYACAHGNLCMLYVLLPYVYSESPRGNGLGVPEQHTSTPAARPSCFQSP
jgi:hypothetical protein